VTGSFMLEFQCVFSVIVFIGPLSSSKLGCFIEFPGPYPTVKPLN